MWDASAGTDRLAAAEAEVRRASSLEPRVGLVLGSGLGSFADELEDRVAVPYTTIPHMPAAAVAGHAGNLVLGRIEGTPVVGMQGRVHLYEGHPVAEVVFGARLMIRLGAGVVILTNAAGACDDDLKPGELMVIEDHLNLTGANPLVGDGDGLQSSRFVDMTHAYDPALRELADEAARQQGIALRHGVYAGMLGPSYETPAEVRMLRTLGAHAVGMSTVLEVIAARAASARVLGLSCITNLGAGLGTRPLSHDEVEQTAGRARARFAGLLRAILAELRSETPA